MHHNAGTAGAAALVFLAGFAVGKLWLPQRRYGLGKPHLKVPRVPSAPAPHLADDAMHTSGSLSQLFVCAALPTGLVQIVHTFASSLAGLAAGDQCGVQVCGGSGYVH